MTIPLTITGTITTTFNSGRTASGSASISGSTELSTMSQEQMDAMQCALIKLLSNSTPPMPMSSNQFKGIVTEAVEGILYATNYLYG